MSRRAEGQLFIGRLSKNTRQRDLEEIFEPYGRMQRCEIKYESSSQNRPEGAEMAYAFVDYEDRRDAEDAIKYENGREVCSSSIIVEWAKGNPRRPLVSNRPRHFGTGDAAKEKGYDECYRCHRPGHWARDCPDDRYYGYRRPGRSNYYRSPSPRRRRRSRSRSRSKDSRRRRRSRSRSRSSRDKRSSSRERRRRSPSSSERRRGGGSGGGRDKHSPDNYKRDKSASRSKSRSRSKSKSVSRSRSRSPSPSRSRSRSASKVKTNGEQDGEVGEKPGRSRSPSRSRSRSRDKFSRQSRSRSASQS